MDDDDDDDYNDVDDDDFLFCSVPSILGKSVHLSVA